MTTQDWALRTNLKGQACREQAEAEQARRHGARYLEYRRRYRAAGRFEWEPPFPLYLMLEQTYLCNLRCPMCIQGMPERREAFDLGGQRMTRELFEKIILEGERHGCPSVSMHVNDEPLLVKDLPERIAFARQHGFMDIIMTTNGTLFTEEKVRQVIEAGVTHILFSLDAATEETYNRVRLGGNYARALAAVEMVRRCRDSRGSLLPILRASFVQNRLNQHETEAFLERFTDRVDYVEIQGFTRYYDRTDHLIPAGSDPIADFTCNEPWRKLIVRANGDVLPCCSFYGYDIPLGNLADSTLYELFNSPMMKTLRRDFQRGVYRNPACRSCSKSFYEPVGLAKVAG